MPQVKYLRRKDAAAYLCMGLSRLDQLTNQERKLPYYKEGNKTLYSIDDLDAYMASIRVARPTASSVDILQTYRKRRVSK